MSWTPGTPSPNWAPLVNPRSLTTCTESPKPVVTPFATCTPRWCAPSSISTRHQVTSPTPTCVCTCCHRAWLSPAPSTSTASSVCCPTTRGRPSARSGWPIWRRHEWRRASPMPPSPSCSSTSSRAWSTSSFPPGCASVTPIASVWEPIWPREPPSCTRGSSTSMLAPWGTPWSRDASARVSSSATAPTSAAAPPSWGPCQEAARSR